MKVQHTPGPWIQLQTEILGQLMEGGPDFIVAYCPTGSREDEYGPHPELAEANAEHIVRAVNSYDEMLEALTSAYSALRSVVTGAQMGILAEIETAIRKATEGRSQE